MSEDLPNIPTLSLTPEVAGALMPMFVWLDADGAIQGVGHTLAKVLGPVPVLGDAFGRHFRIRRARLGGDGRDRIIEGDSRDAPHRATASGSGVPVDDILSASQARLHLELVARPEIGLRGTAVGLASGGGVLLNLTFGIQLAEAVRGFALTEGDFAASDLAIELLYLGEANAAVMGELSELTARLERARRMAVAQSMTDPLTGLANRRAFDLALEAEMRALEEGGPPFAVGHIDLDHFKQVNDSHGHAAGDRVLSQIGGRMVSQLRQGDVVARTGGDEFVILLRGAIPANLLWGLGARLIQGIEEPCDVDGRACRVSASIGIAVACAGEDATALLARADSALYAAKRSGRGQCEVALMPASPGTGT